MARPVHGTLKPQHRQGASGHHENSTINGPLANGNRAVISRGFQGNHSSEHANHKPPAKLITIQMSYQLLAHKQTKKTFHIRFSSCYQNVRRYGPLTRRYLGPKAASILNHARVSARHETRQSQNFKSMRCDGLQNASFRVILIARQSTASRVALRPAPTLGENSSLPIPRPS